MASTSFHLSSAEAQSADLKTMTTSVDRLFGDMTIDSFHQGAVQEQKLLNHHNNNGAPQSVLGKPSLISYKPQGPQSKAAQEGFSQQSFDSTRHSSDVNCDTTSKKHRITQDSILILLFTRIWTAYQLQRQSS